MRESTCRQRLFRRRLSSVSATAASCAWVSFFFGSGYHPYEPAELRFRYSRVSHPRADTASGISNSGSHFMATYVRYSIPIAKLPSGNVFPEVHSSISSPCCQKLAIHPHKRNPSCCHLRFLLCKGIAALADDKQRSMTRYRQKSHRFYGFSFPSKRAFF